MVQDSLDELSKKTIEVLCKQASKFAPIVSLSGEVAVVELGVAKGEGAVLAVVSSPMIPLIRNDGSCWSSDGGSSQMRGGRLACFAQRWQQYATDPYLLQ